MQVPTVKQWGRNRRTSTMSSSEQLASSVVGRRSYAVRLSHESFFVCGNSTPCQDRLPPCTIPPIYDLAEHDTDYAAACLQCNDAILVESLPA
jgi:hypothetical protein